MLTVEDLKHVKQMRRQVESCEESILRLRSAVESATASYRETGGVKTSGTGDKIADYVGRLDELQWQRLEMIEALEVKLLEVDAWVASLPEMEGKVIRARYLEPFYGWGRIAREVGYSLDGTYKVHRRALKRLPRA